MSKSKFRAASVARVPARQWLGLVALTGALQACGGSGVADRPGESADASSAAPAVVSPRDPAHVAARAAALPGQRHYGGMGVNLSGFDYWSNDFPTIDQFKRASPWITSKDGVWDTGEEAQLDLDENGWVKSLPAAGDGNVRYRYVVADMFQGDRGDHPAGVYTVLYDGSGAIEYDGIGSLVSASKGRDLVRVSNSGQDEGGGFLLKIKQTTAGDHIRNIRVIPPGGVCSAARNVYVPGPGACSGEYITLETLSQTQAWFPTFLADLGGMRTLRFMDWGRTNSSKLADWADRPLKTDATWTGPFGVPVGMMFDLANSLKADAWINLPTRANDDYARRFARVAKASLNAKAKLILEYSNEPWNGGFWDNYQWQYAQAVGLWGDPELDDDPDTTPFGWQQNWHALRAAQLCDIVKAEFGAEAGRVECVINAQAATTWTAEHVLLPCPKAAPILGKPCADSFDAVAIAPYFGVYLSDHAYRDRIVKTWFAQPDAGLDKLFEEILARDKNGQPVQTPLRDIAARRNPDAVGGAVAQSDIWMRNYRDDIARGAYAKPIYAYEGGQHLINGSAYECKDKDPPDCAAVEAEFQAKWQGLWLRANRDPRMGQAYADMMGHWLASQGQVFVQFNFAGAYSKHGAWGLRESLFKTAAESPKWSAVLPYRDSVPCWWDGCAADTTVAAR